MTTLNLTSVVQWQRQYDAWRKSLGTSKLILFAFFVATLTGIAAQIKFMLPGTPVPVTLQTSMVLLSGVLLGRNWGGISQLLYVGFGALGVPWFAGTTGGLAYFAGPTAGYLIGFILTAFVMGYLYDKSTESRRWLPLLGLMIFCNLFLIYIPGLLYLGVWLHVVKGSFGGIVPLLWMGFFPFLLGDLLKILLASAAAVGIANKS